MPLQKKDAHSGWDLMGRGGIEMYSTLVETEPVQTQPYFLYAS